MVQIAVVGSKFVENKEDEEEEWEEEEFVLRLIPKRKVQKYIYFLKSTIYAILQKEL